MHAKTRHPSEGQTAQRGFRPQPTLRRKTRNRELVAQAKQGFERWRRSPKRSRRIPERLWRMAAKAASIHGVYATARELRLNATRLKEQIRSLGQGRTSELREQVRSLGQDRDAEKTPGFVEFPWLGATPVSECILEAEDREGGKLCAFGKRA